MKYTIEYRIESTFNLEVSAESKEQALAEFKKLDITSEVIDSISDNPLAHFEISVQDITFLKRNLIGKASRKKDDTKDHIGELWEEKK